jgi:hypothetical protein
MTNAQWRRRFAHLLMGMAGARRAPTTPPQADKHLTFVIRHFSFSLDADYSGILRE